MMPACLLLRPRSDVSQRNHKNAGESPAERHNTLIHVRALVAQRRVLGKIQTDTPPAEQNKERKARPPALDDAFRDGTEMGKGAGSRNHRGKGKRRTSGGDGDPPKPGLPEAGGASQLIMQRSLDHETC